MLPGHAEIWIILGIILILFGGKKIPELAKGLGKGIREFKKARTEIDDEADNVKQEIEDKSPGANK